MRCLSESSEIEAIGQSSVAGAASRPTWEGAIPGLSGGGITTTLIRKGFK
jgi:hypothetical protein